MNHKISYKILRIGVWVGCILLVASYFVMMGFSRPVGYGMLAAGAIVGLGSLFQSKKFLLCPHCKNQLDGRDRKVETCPHCGTPIEW